MDMVYSFRRFLLLLLFFLCAPTLFAIAQGIKGTVSDEAGAPLPYATIYVANLNLGASSNLEGEYEIPLPNGKHTIQVQYIGYERQNLEIVVSDNWVVHQFVLPEQTVLLEELKVSSKQEDPAYTIMRKAISKRKYHLLQYDSYKVRVYMKGTGVLEKAPFFLKKQIEEEGGVKLNEAYTIESVSEVTFKQPNTVEEKVISIRTTGDGEVPPSPALFINQSFYQDKIAEVISPLSGAAFAYYRFRYEGSFMEGKYEINKIRVIPRSRGEQVFEGYIYIIEDLWALHSLDLKTSIKGFSIPIKVNYEEILPKLWMPVTHRVQFSGKALGFGGKYNFIASLSDYRVDLNEDLIPETEIIDEKIQEVPQEVGDLKAKGKEKEEVVELLEQEDKMTRKQFRKMIDQYEKEALKERKEPEVISEKYHSVDSMATKRDSAYWAQIRPVPLTPLEIKGYERDDSLARIKSARITGVDTTNAIKKNRFKTKDILLGGTYNLSPRTELSLKPTLLHTYFNTVEGVNVNVSASLKHEFDSLRKSLEFTPIARYGFSSEDFYGLARVSYRSRKKEISSRIYAEGGKFVSQFSEQQLIHPHINTLSTLLFRRNYMKIYEKAYGKVGFAFKPSHWIRLESNLEWAQRHDLYNRNDYSFFYRSRSFTPNQPYNRELPSTGFGKHEALIFKAGIQYWPIKSYSIYNGRRRPLFNRSPELRVNYTKGIANLLGSDVDYDQIELGINHGFQFGVSGRLQFELRGGAFLNNNKTFLMDYKHFEGNRTILSSVKPAGAFRLLDYYAFSTDNAYFSAHTYYEFRKFLFTQIPELSFTGVRENIFFNYLKTEHSPHYYEIGYSLDQVFQFLRVEVAASFEDNNYQELGLRIGIATILSFGQQRVDVNVY